MWKIASIPSKIALQTTKRRDASMDFLDLAKQRYSERFFDSRPIEQEKLDKILEAGRVVPTACNYQPQRF